MTNNNLLQRLNTTPIKLHVELMKLHLQDFTFLIQSAETFIKEEMMKKGMLIGKKYMEEENIIKFINQFLIKNPKDQTFLFNNQRIDLALLKQIFPNEPFILAYSQFREYCSLKLRYESILKFENNGYIQPTFGINTKGNIYTFKPALLLPQSTLKQIFDCDSYTFSSLEKAMNAIENAKEDTEIITVLKSTVYFRNNKYKQEKEKRRHALIKFIEEQGAFILSDLYYEEFTLSELGYS